MQRRPCSPPPAGRRIARDRGAPWSGENTTTDVDALRRTLPEVRRTGVAIAADQLTAEALAPAVPVRDPGGEVVAAVGVTLHRSAVRSHAPVPALAATAPGISRTLGTPSAGTAGPRAARRSMQPDLH